MPAHALASPPPSPTPGGKKSGKARKTNAIMALVLILAGLCVLLYPVVSTQWNNYRQQRVAEEYSKLEQSTPPEVNEAAWNEAHRYNDERASLPIADAWTSAADESDPAYQDYLSYLSQLSSTDAMARILIPSIDSDLPIYHGTGTEALARGAGHLYGTDLPVGGVGRHAALSAHTGLQNATLWDNLTKVEVGDAFYIAVAGHKLKYEVDQIKVVLPEETDDLRRVEGQDLITLITCTPYGINTHRLLVRGHQVPMDPEEEAIFEESGGLHWQWWMWALLAAALVIVVALVWWLRRTFKR